LADLFEMGLLNADQVDRLIGGWNGGTAKQRAEQLVQAGLLTPFQVEKILGGSGHRLRMGRYRLLDRIGNGGMGRVYKAEHLLLKRVVALKVAGISRAKGAKARQNAFRREVRILASVSHPNLVTAFDAGRAGKRLFLVMEFVEGTDLERLLAQAGPLPIPLACEAVRQAALALDCLHQHGLVHRDVKPANLLLVPGDQFKSKPDAVLVKLLDLGLARRSAGGRGPLEGTVHYMPPERADETSPPDIRGDLYSLGCTFYHLLTGQVPFPADSWPECLIKHQVEEPIPLRELRPDTPRYIEAIVGKLMARDIEERYANPGAVVHALENPWVEKSRTPWQPVEVAISQPEQVKPSPKQNFLPGTVLCVAALLLGGGAAFLARGLPRETQGPQSHGQAPSQEVKPPPKLFVLGDATAFHTLAEAVKAAPDGGTITLPGGSHWDTEPLDLIGKSLTLKAGAGAPPRLQRAPDNNNPWQPLLTTDRSLVLEGLELVRPSHEGPWPLLCVQGAPVRLTGCRLRGSGRGPLVSYRLGEILQVSRCRFEADQVALLIQAGRASTCRVDVADSEFVVRGNEGTALSLWEDEWESATAIDLDLRGNVCLAGRVVACRSPRAVVRTQATGNRFSFRHSLVGLDGYGDNGAWNKALSWQGKDNRYMPAGPWVRVEGKGEDGKELGFPPR
jgi:serine/threonine protein kinase